MSFRDDREAMRARIDELEADLGRAQRRVEELETERGDLEAMRARVLQLEVELAKLRQSPEERARREKAEKEARREAQRQKEAEKQKQKQQEAEAARQKARAAERATSSSDSESGESTVTWRDFFKFPRVLGVLVGGIVLGAVWYFFLLPPTWNYADAAPTLGVVDLGRTPDPAPVQGTAEGGHFAPMGCAGVIPGPPQLVVRTEEASRVSFRTSASGDTVLVVLAADGTVSCDDDSGGGGNALVQAALPPGEHRVWVGIYDGESGAVPFSLAISARAVPSGGIDARGLSPRTEPTHGRIGLTDGPQERTGTATAEVSASAIDEDCRGWLPVVPTAALVVAEPSFVRLDGIASDDLVLFVDGPGGVRCDDDGGPGNAPLIAERFEAGTYLVWLGRYSQSDAPIAYSLRIEGSPVTAGRVAIAAQQFVEGQSLTAVGESGLVREASCDAMIPVTPSLVLELPHALDVTVAGGSGTQLVTRGAHGVTCLSGGAASWPVGRYEVFVVADVEARGPSSVTLTAAAPTLLPYGTP